MHWVSSSIVVTVYWLNRYEKRFRVSKANFLERH
jgi:hypothetical protein